jgi:hypothetical protein
MFSKHFFLIVLFAFDVTNGLLCYDREVFIVNSIISFKAIHMYYIFDEDVIGL